MFKLKTSYEEVRGIIIYLLIYFFFRPALILVKKIPEFMFSTLGVPEYISKAIASYIIVSFLYFFGYKRLIKKNPYNTKLRKEFIIWIVLVIILFVYTIIKNRP